MARCSAVRLSSAVAVCGRSGLGLLTRSTVFLRLVSVSVSSTKLSQRPRQSAGSPAGEHLLVSPGARVGSASAQQPWQGALSAEGWAVLLWSAPEGPKLGLAAREEANRAVCGVVRSRRAMGTVSMGCRDSQQGSGHFPVPAEPLVPSRLGAQVASEGTSGLRPSGLCSERPTGLCVSECLPRETEAPGPRGLKAARDGQAKLPVLPPLSPRVAPSWGAPADTQPHTICSALQLQGSPQACWPLPRAMYTHPMPLGQQAQPHQRPLHMIERLPPLVLGAGRTGPPELSYLTPSQRGQTGQEANQAGHEQHP